MNFARHLYALLIAVFLPWGAVIAEDLPAPTGEVLLTVSGAVPMTNSNETAQFDMDLLRSLGDVNFTTTTPWTTGQQSFTGVPLRELLDQLGIREGKLTATAINDYAVDIPLSDAVEGGPIIAYLHNGEPMSVRDKGPLWIVYPYDANKAYQSESVYARSIWQLDRILVSD
ncbi:molybdopterin-dependent oxidoreductase [Loktanella sp. SALINAS62]|nr:molybdopterin-dependent oxidoreductase [Loktanella sp. SALINAS62]MBS1302703.1 molybdopterin-dependent oxidoreductase [Loktanella sp. SALINAS62]